MRCRIASIAFWELLQGSVTELETAGGTQISCSTRQVSRGVDASPGVEDGGLNRVLASWLRVAVVSPTSRRCQDHPAAPSSFLDWHALAKREQTRVSQSRAIRAAAQGRGRTPRQGGRGRGDRREQGGKGEDRVCSGESGRFRSR